MHSNGFVVESDLVIEHLLAVVRKVFRRFGKWASFRLPV
jgi:hypothetical protein